MVCICLFQFLLCLGQIFLWILFWDWLEPRGGGIAFLLWWIDFLKWHTLYHVIKPMMLFILLTSFSKRLFACMVCPLLLFQIAMLNSWVTFGTHFGVNWDQSCYFLPHATHKLMDKLKS